MLAANVKPGSKIKYNFNSHLCAEALCIGKIDLNSIYILLGWQSNPPTFAWNKYGSFPEADPFLEKHGCIAGYYILHDDEVEVLEELRPMKASASCGIACCLCHNYNNWAEPNRPNGKFICWSCRQGWIPSGY